MSSQARRFIPVFVAAAMLLIGSLCPAQDAAKAEAPKADAVLAQNATKTPITNLTTANTVLEEAHLAFERGDAVTAMRQYERVAKAGFGTAKVWSNAGTAAYRAGDMGRAVLYYSRALRQDPDNYRALKSLEVASPATNTSSGSFGEDALRYTLRHTPIGMWIGLAELCFLLFCFGIAKLMATVTREDRGHWVAVLGWSGVGLLLFAAISWGAHEARVGGNEAVVLKAGAVAYSEPNSSSVAQLEIPAGTLVQMTEAPRRGFVRIKMMDGSAGYLATDTLESI